MSLLNQIVSYLKQLGFSATGVKHISMKSVGSVKDFYAFGIYGRDFDLDEEADGAGLLKTSILFVGICALTSTFRSFV